MDKEIFVYVDLNGQPVLAGHLWAHSRKSRETATYEYDRDWLIRPESFSIEPALMLGPGPFYSGEKALFGVLGDSAPDRWGRVLMRRAHRRQAVRLGVTPTTLQEVDYLLMVDDEARQGALRFALTEGGPFLAQSGASRIPPFLELPRLLTAAQHVITDSESDDDLRLLLAPGSSLGGARPKASVRDKDGHLTIAKFQTTEDEYSTVLWEAVALSLASQAKISVPAFRVELVSNYPVLLVRRFDRLDSLRVPFLSAMSMLEARDNEQRSYLELVDALRRYGASPLADIHALWRRIVFNILISNTDDHLRNHGFLYSASAGWQLSPAYDLNPVPIDIKPRILSTAIDFQDSSASLDLAFDVSAYFELSLSEAREIVREVASAISFWRKVAASFGISRKEIERMSSAFEHEEQIKSLKH